MSIKTRCIVGRLTDLAPTGSRPYCQLAFVGNLVGNFVETISAAQRLATSCLGLLLAGLLLPTAALAGSWAPVSTTAPDRVELMLLLSDGTVMAANGYTSGGAYGNAWYRLTPDSQGHYATGAWTTRAPMNSTRLWYSAAVLRDGRVLVAGAEYGTGWNTSEVYDPASDSWTTISVPAALLNQNNVIVNGGNSAGFVDSISKIIANGNVLVAPVSPGTFGGTILFNPVSNTWSAGPQLFRGGWQDEASWVKLPDNSILTIDPFGTQSERYIPSLNTWINDGVVPVSVYDPYGSEMGAGFLLPNGKAFFLGATGSTALYTPSGNTNFGTWAAGPVIPNGQGTPDAGAAMMVNGKILCAVSPTPVSTNHFPTPTSFYEYDYSSGSIGSFAQVNGPTGVTDPIPSYQAIMLDLPDGTVLYSHFSPQLYVYTPSGSPLAAGKPTINSISQNFDGSFHLTGTRFNGISEGAAYGDDAQMNSNYPLIRLTDGGGNVSYVRSYNWSSTGVMNPNVVSTDFAPSEFPGVYSLQVVANGIASDAITFVGPAWVDFNYGGFLSFGTYYFPYKSFAAGVAGVAAGGTVEIKTGTSTETMTVTKAMEVRAYGGPVKIGAGH